MESYFKNKKLFLKRYEKNNKYALAVTFENSRTPKIFLNGHLDVVDASDEEFMPRIESETLYGRGAADMKGAVAAMMKVIDYFAECEMTPSLGLMLTTDEEEGGFNPRKISKFSNKPKAKTKSAFLSFNGIVLASACIIEAFLFVFW